MVNLMKTNTNANKRPFAERHPKLNFLLGLGLLLSFAGLLILAVYITGKYTIAGVTIAANWLTSLTSKLDAVVIVNLNYGVCFYSWRFDKFNYCKTHRI